MGMRMHHDLFYSSRKSIPFSSSSHILCLSSCPSVLRKTPSQTRKIYLCLSTARSSYLSTPVLASMHFRSINTINRPVKSMTVHTLYPVVTLSFSWCLQMHRNFIPIYQTQLALLMGNRRALKTFHSHQNLSSHDQWGLQIS